MTSKPPLYYLRTYPLPVSPRGLTLARFPVPRAKRRISPGCALLVLLGLIAPTCLRLRAPQPPIDPQALARWHNKTAWSMSIFVMMLMTIGRDIDPALTSDRAAQREAYQTAKADSNQDSKSNLAPRRR